MIHTSDNAPTMSRLQTTYLAQKVYSIPPKVQSKTQKTPGSDSDSIGKTAASTIPLEIGSKGTVGSLLRQELDYFSWIESGCQDSCPKGCRQIMETGSIRSVMFTLESPITSPRKKKGGTKLIPRMCSMVEVADSTQPKSLSRLTYRSLKTDLRRAPV